MIKNPPTFLHLLSPYKIEIEQLIAKSISTFGPPNKLREACEYALMNGGKRFRPALVLMIAKALNKGFDASQTALGIEYFHTASLIADDLPCMDDDDQRRDHPSTHKVFGEAVALLATYALISAGYACLAKNSQIIKKTQPSYAHRADEVCVIALENVSLNTGLFGATGGQYLDIAPPNLSLVTLREIIQKKTVTLFEISFVLGWIYGGGAFEKLDQVKKTASHFGYAFQIADDLGDMEQDIANNRLINLANVCGKDVANKMFHEELQQFHASLALLGLRSDEFIALSEMLQYQVTLV